MVPGLGTMVAVAWTSASTPLSPFRELSATNSPRWLIPLSRQVRARQREDGGVELYALQSRLTRLEGDLAEVAVARQEVGAALKEAQEASRSAQRAMEEEERRCAHAGTALRTSRAELDALSVDLETASAALACARSEAGVHRRTARADSNAAASDAARHAVAHLLNLNLTGRVQSAQAELRLHDTQCETLAAAAVEGHAQLAAATEQLECARFEGRRLHDRWKEAVVAGASKREQLQVRGWGRECHRMD